METDRELLELAAKAAGYEKIEYHDLKGSMLDIRYGRDEAIWNGEDYWNPLVDDSEALRLAVKVKLDVMCHELGAHVDNELSYHAEISHTDPYSATRRAIVRAAAEIGKEMKT
jgi:hypothetical protein